MDLYNQTKVKGQGSLELAPEKMKKENEKLHFFLPKLTQLVQAYQCSP